MDKPCDLRQFTLQSASNRVLFSLKSRTNLS